MRIVIIGNGIAGITAARHIRKQSDAEIVIISGESKYFFSRTALMYVYMGHMKFEHTQPYENWFWKKNKLNLVQDWAETIMPDQKIVSLASGGSVTYDKLILATGSKPVRLDIPGTDLAGVQSLYSKQDLELMEANTKSIKRAVVVGGGLIGVEMAEMLHSRSIDVTMVIRESSFWDIVLPKEESEMVTRHIQSRHVKVITDTTVAAIEGSDRVEAIKLSNGELIETDFVGITIGVQPSIDLVRELPIDTNRGILVDKYLQTSHQDIYAIGDCAELRDVPEGRKAIEAIWYSGRKMGETVAVTITGEPTAYQPGLWFNSAKFFDLEYQTYGFVPNHDEAGVSQYYWEDRTEEIALRIVTDTNGKVVGFNALGLRLNQQVCEDWIVQGISLNAALQRIREIDFDPEFTGRLGKLVKTEAVS